MRHSIKQFFEKVKRLRVAELVGSLVGTLADGFNALFRRKLKLYLTVTTQTADWEEEIPRCSERGIYMHHTVSFLHIQC